MANTTITPNQSTLVISTANVVLGPLTGALALVGPAPIANPGAPLVPVAASLTLTGQATAQILGLPAPPAGSLTMAGDPPTLTISVSFITPNVGSLNVTGQSPGVSGSSLPGSGTLALTGNSPVLSTSLNLHPLIAALNLGSSPSHMDLKPTAPGTGSATYTGYVPFFNTPMTPNAGTLTIAGTQSGLSPGLTPNAGELDLVGGTPGGGNSYNLSPISGAAFFAGQSPQVNGQIIEAPPTGVLTLTGPAPSIALHGTTTPGSATLTIGSAAARQSAGFVPPVATLALTGYAPTKNALSNLAPPAASLALTAVHAVADLGIVPRAGGANFATAPPTIVRTTNGLLLPDTGILTLSSDAPSIGAQGRIYGHSIVTALSQSGVQGARSVYIENSACQIFAQYYNTQDLLFAPQSVDYNVVDVVSGEELVNWTTLPVATANEFTITSAQNAMVSKSRIWETHQVLLRITDGLGAVNYARVLFDILRVQGFA